MDTTKNADFNSAKEIVFSRTVKAGKRIYYIDVKRNKKEEYYLAITESKKIVTGEGEDARVNFEKHKIFLYQEDFTNIMGSLQEAISFIEDKQGTSDPRPEISNEIKVDIEF